MNGEEAYMKYCKYDKEPKEVIINLINVIEKQQAEIEIHTNLEHQYKKEYLDIKEVAEKKDKFYKKLAEDNEFYAEEIEKKDRIIYSMSDLLNDGLREGIYINSEVGSIDFCMCNSREEVKQYFERKVENGN